MRYHSRCVRHCPRLARQKVALLVIGPALILLLYILLASLDGQYDRLHRPEVDVFWLRSALNNVSTSVFLPASLDGGVVGDNRSTATSPWGQCPGSVTDDDQNEWKACQPVLTGERGWAPRKSRLTPAVYVERAQNCGCFRSDLGYFASPEYTTDEERSFPIAFSLLTYENLEQTERLLRLIYRPHNVYCIHVDAKASGQLSDGLEAIANCLENVFVAQPAIAVYWGNISVVHAEMLCMKELLKHDKSWKYFINVVGRDFPLRTNLELVKILTAYNGGNDVRGTRDIHNRYFPDWFKYSWVAFDQRGSLKEPVPHGFNVTKGSAHIAVTREFVEFAVSDSRAQDLLFWMSDIKVPDEHFFQTLSHNPQMNVPGSFKGAPGTKPSFTRAKRWTFLPGHTCSGEWIRWICNVGVGDLPWVIASPHMFVNKIRIEQDAAAFRCLELWYRDRVEQQRHLANENVTFDVSIYVSQPFAQHHV